jgi:EF hand
MKYLLSTAAVALAMTATAMPAAAQQQADCTRNFKAVDANGDGKVSNQEATAAVSNEFNAIDTDGSGTISQSEWQNCGTQINTMMDTKRSNMQASDHAPMQNQQQSGQQQAGQQQSGQSGQQQSGQSGQQQAGQQQSGQQQSGQQASQQSGQQQQASQSGQQSGDQIQSPTTGQSGSTATLNQEGPPRPWTTDEQFEQADKDKSGDVSREEAAQMAQENYSKSGSQAAHEQQARASGVRFGAIDSNGDGSISQDEWSNRAQADIDAFFARLDQDSNDKLSKQEYQQARMQQAAEPVTVWYYYYVY